MKTENESMASKTLKNLLWKFAERIGAQGVKFIVSLVLARILLPSDYGTIALISIFISIMNVFIESGLGTALIQKKDADDLDFSSVFYFNLVMCIALYLCMYFCAPYIATFYNNSELTPIIRVLSITLIISGLKNVQQAYVAKKMIFKKFFFATLGGTIGAAVLGIFLAYRGFGVWALVAQQLFNITVDTFILWISVSWRPVLKFSLTRLKVLFAYGWKLLVSSLLHTVYMDIRSLIIGKKYSADDLAFFNKGTDFPTFITSNINASIDSVLLPVMSSAQSEIEKVKGITRRSIMISSFLMWPLMMGLAGVANNVIPLLLTEKWVPCIPFLYIFCFNYGTEPLSTANLNAIRALGHSELILKMEIIKKIIALAIVVAAIPFGVMGIAISSTIYTFISIIINSFPNKKLLNYTLFEMLKDIMPSFVISLIMFFIVFFMNYLPINSILLLIIQILVGAVFYIFMSYAFKIKAFNYSINMIRNSIGKKD